MSKLSKKDPQAELSKLIQEESTIDSDLRQYFNALGDGKSSQIHSKSFNSSDLGDNLK